MSNEVYIALGWTAAAFVIGWIVIDAYKFFKNERRFKDEKKRT